MAISHEGVFGNGSYEQRLMPIVFIDKITLENNSIPPTPTDNPHIVDTIKDLQALEGIGLQGYLLYEKATVQTGPSGCYVTINMIVKDIIENSSLSSWFYDAELLKYMQIRIIQSTDKNLTSSLISGKFAVLEKPESEGLFQEQILTLSQYYESTKDFYSIDETGRNNIASIPSEAKHNERNGYSGRVNSESILHFLYSRGRCVGWSSSPAQRTMDGRCVSHGITTPYFTQRDCYKQYDTGFPRHRFL